MMKNSIKRIKKVDDSVFEVFLDNGKAGIAKKNEENKFECSPNIRELVTVQEVEKHIVDHLKK